MESKLITIIVPVYKVEQYLENCIDSIIRQTYKKLEIILVDDGSPDRCPYICDEYARKDNRIRVIHKANGGLSDARNAGLDAATGEYIAFVDSDDCIHDNMIERLYRALAESNADISMCGFIYVNEEYQSILNLNRESPIKDEILSREQVINKLFEYKYWYYFFVWNKLYKRRLFDNIRFPYGRLCEDSYIAHHLFGQCEKVVSISDTLYYYLQRSNSIMGYFYDNHAKELYMNVCECYIDCMYYLKTIDLDEYAAKAYNLCVELYYYKIYRLKNDNSEKINSEKIILLEKEIRKNYPISKYLSIKKRIILFTISFCPEVYTAYTYIRNRRT